MPACIVARLNQHEAEIVVRFGVFRAKADRFAEFRRHGRAVRAFLPEHAAEDVVRLRICRLSRERLAKPCDRGVPIGHGTRRRREVQSGLELTERPGWLARGEERDREIHIDRGHRRPQRNRALKTCARASEITRFTQRHPQKSVARPERWIEARALSQLDDRLVLRSAVPLRDAEVVVGLGGFGAKRDRLLEDASALMGDRPSAPG